MSDSSKPLLVVLVLLQLATLGVVATPMLRDLAAGEDDEADDTTDLEEVAEEIKFARYELKQAVERMTRLADAPRGAPGLAAGDGVAAAGTAPVPAEALKDMSIEALIDRELELNEMHGRYQHDPMQREPIEKARAEVEQELRGRGAPVLDALGPRLARTADSRAQSRLITNVLEPLADAEATRKEAIDVALYVFDNPDFVSGVRLLGARIAMKDPAQKDRVVGRLIELLGEIESDFPHRPQIAQFLRDEPDPRAIPVLTSLAKDTDVDTSLRYHVLITLGAYQGPEVIDALKDVCMEEIHGELRSAALHSLNSVLGKDILDFLDFLEPRLAATDPLKTQVQNFRQHWTQK